MAQNQRLFETAFRRSPVIQDTARLLQTTQWPGLARQFGFGKTFRGGPAALALQGLSAHQNLVGVRLADAFAKSASFRIAENTQRTLTSLLTTRSRLIEDSLRPLRMYRGVFDALGESVRRFAEQQREMDEHTDAFVVRHGWPVPLNLPLPAYVQIVRMAASPEARSHPVDGSLVSAAVEGIQDMRRDAPFASSSGIEKPPPPPSVACPPAWRPLPRHQHTDAARRRCPRRQVSSVLLVRPRKRVARRRRYRSSRRKTRMTRWCARSETS